MSSGTCRRLSASGVNVVNGPGFLQSGRRDPATAKSKAPGLQTSAERRGSCIEGARRSLGVVGGGLLCLSVGEDVVQPDSQLSSFCRSGTRSTPDSRQRSWSGCRLWRRRTKRWENVTCAEWCSVQHAVRWDDL